MATWPAGTCGLAACPVRDGEGNCLIGETPLTCENYEPDADAAAAGEVVEAAGPAAGPGTTADDPPTGAGQPTAAREQAREPSTEPDQPAALPRVTGAAFAEAEAGKEAARRPGRAPSRVPEPGGPRRRVDLAQAGTVDLPSGLALIAQEAGEVLAAERASTVVLAAPPDSGKTTLLAALHESFLRGPVGPWTFAGSETLLGFTQRAWHANTASGRESAATDRTKIGVGRPWLHLRLGRDGRHRSTLLLADLSGEYFRDVASGQPLGEAEPICGRAAHVVHFVDAGLYEAPTERARARQATADRLRRLAEISAFPPVALHTVVISRADLCPPDYRDELRASVEDVRSRWLPGAPVIELAARPRDHSPALGLAQLLDAVTRSDPPASPDPAPPLRFTVERVARAGGSARNDIT